MYTTEVKFGPLLGAGTLLGMGLSGFFDIIVFHLIFQTHHMISARVPPNTLENLQTNMFWGGIFQILTWSLTLTGIIFLWTACLNPYTPKSSRAFTGSMFMGWGLYNSMEGFVNHILLKAHHVLERGSETEIYMWDLAYILSGVVFSVIGRVLITQGRKRFYSTQVHKARHKGFRFRPAFARRTTPYPESVNIHPSVHASSESLSDDIPH